VSIIELSKPVRATAQETFFQLIRFDGYPDFMHAVDQAAPDADTPGRMSFRYTSGNATLHYTVDIDSSEEFAEVHWTSVDGPKHTGLARVIATDSGDSELRVRVDLRPAGVIANRDDVLGAIRSRMEHDMEQFAEYVERGGGEAPMPSAEHRSTMERLFGKLFSGSRRRA